MSDAVLTRDQTIQELRAMVGETVRLTCINDIAVVTAEGVLSVSETIDEHDEVLVQYEIEGEGEHLEAWIATHRIDHGRWIDYEFDGPYRSLEMWPRLDPDPPNDVTAPRAYIYAVGS